MKGVFDVKPGSRYDDDLPTRYQFPESLPNLAVANDCVGDWIVYREPRRDGGREVYIGAARVVAIEPGPGGKGSLAVARMRDFEPFPTLVPLRADGRYFEARLRDLARPSLAGVTLHGKSLRLISDDDFDALVLAGLSETLAPENAVRLDLDPRELALPQADGLDEGGPRRVELLLMNRKVRDANFRLEVCRAYDSRCAVTGLRIVNGGGRAEVQAAHIQPVSADGPDIVQNGLALSATVHWLFDRHLISIDEDYTLLVAHNRVPTELANLFRRSREPIIRPSNERFWPSQKFLAHHRDRFAASG